MIPLNAPFPDIKKVLRIAPLRCRMLPDLVGEGAEFHEFISQGVISS